jgi:hypothetical protein
MEEQLKVAFSVRPAQNYEGNKQKSYIIKMDMFATKLDTENIRGLNLAVVKLTTVQVTELPL